MFTSFDKAIAALVGGVISVLVLFGLPVPEFLTDPAWIASVSGAIAGALTWIVPNKA